ncbi:23 kDa integral membrane protein-like [Scaptodrosophila lebanonensis]|uniref:Tetraspanin n=1 Tax=Drosophila lebanonensis TaxID=7225 RepID=A0A6J2TK37_DROLE|nr:23 kDa integral membrane protein-like [Scaptodrosophila lebanonensis]
MDCGAVFVKYVLYIFNTLCLICGILIIVFGSTLISKISIFSDLAQTFDGRGVFIFLVVVGCIIFLISFLGCWGAIRENKCSIITYSIFMLALFLCQASVIVYVWKEQTYIITYFANVLQQIWEHRREEKRFLYAIQKTLECCGFNDFKDYNSSLLPKSCCNLSVTRCDVNQVIGVPGCKTALSNFWETYIPVIKYAGLGVAVVELTAFIFAFCLANQIRYY